jgi:hypothetical protein
MTQTIQCSTCHGTIGSHWQVQLHASCRALILEQAVRAMVAPPGEEGKASLTWCKGCQEYHMGPHTPQLGRRVRRAVTKMLREW